MATDFPRRAEYEPDRVELLRRFIDRRNYLLLVPDSALPRELEAVQRGISWLRVHIDPKTEHTIGTDRDS